MLLCRQPRNTALFTDLRNRSKKSKKTVDYPVFVCESCPAHGKNTQNTNKMRTKITVLAAAALAAGVTGASAQVYSQNIVGYVNVVCKGNAFTLVANPLDNGTNDANSLFAALPNKSTVQVWNGTGFTSATKGASGFTPNLSLPVGTGFFVKPLGGDYTNTFVGNVAVASGASATNNLPAGTFVLAGSTIPVAGALNDTGVGTLNLAATLPNKSTVQVWDNTGSGGFVSSTKGASGFTPNTSIAVGQGFFIKALTATNWVQSLP
jgi:hypothetical protein